MIVNGAIVFEEGAMTPARPGRVLRAQPGAASASAKGFGETSP